MIVILSSIWLHAENVMVNMWVKAKQYLRKDIQTIKGKSRTILEDLAITTMRPVVAVVTVILIEQVVEKTPQFLAEREVYWQHQLRVYIENGCRAHCYRKEV